MNESNKKTSCHLSFIISTPRSGSSWIGNIFNSHHDVVYRHEPLGRLNRYISDKTLHNLKTNYGLSERDRQEILEILYSSFPETDRPPFFDKTFCSCSLKFKYVLWLMAANLGIGNRLYNKLFGLNVLDSRTKVVFKETGWSAHLESIIYGLRPEMTFMVYRHPCAIISSIIDGVNRGLMNKPDTSSKNEWYDNHSGLKIFPEFGLNRRRVLEMNDLSFMALRINMLYCIFQSIKCNGDFASYDIVYENLQKDPVALGKDIFSTIGLDFDNQTRYFLEESTGGKEGIENISLKNDSKSEYYSVKRGRTFSPHKWKERLDRQQTRIILESVKPEIVEKYWPETA